MQETDELQVVIAAMWANARPRMLARVEALEAAVAADPADGEREHALEARDREGVCAAIETD